MNFPWIFLTRESAGLSVLKYVMGVVRALTTKASSRCHYARGLILCLGALGLLLAAGSPLLAQVQTQMQEDNSLPGGHAESSPSAQTQYGVPVEITADGENRFEANMAYASGNVVVRYGDDLLYADEIAYDRQNQEVTATGSVRIYAGENIYRGERLVYNFTTQKLVSNGFALASDRVYAAGESVTTPKDGKYVIRDAYVSSENREKPSYRVAAKTIEIYPDDRVVFKNACFYVGDLPFFWVPYYSYSLKENNALLESVVGVNERWGMYALNAIKWQINSQWEMTPHFDYRSRRGFGGGVDMAYRPKVGQKSVLKTFYTHDEGNDINISSRERLAEPPSERYRASYRQSTEVTPDVFALADVNLWSDQYVTQDFFPDEFDKERVPDNVMELTYYNDNFTITGLGRAQLNDIFEVSERKPELKIELKRQKIPFTPISYEGESSVVSFEKRYDRDDPLHPDSYRAVRYDTFHQILYQRQYFGWLSLTPRAGIRGTYYTRNNLEDNPDPHQDVARFVFNTGLEASFKLSKTWQDVRCERLGIYGLRHVVEPFINLSYVPTPNKTPDEFRGFDTRLPSTHPAPLNYPAFNSIDSIDQLTVLRHGVRNKLQTQRDGANVDLIDWLIYADLDLEREQGFLVDAPYPQVYNELEVNPVPWLRLNIDSALGLSDDSYNEFNSKLTWQPVAALELSVGNRYISNVPVFDPHTGDRVIENSHLFSFGSFYRINESWKFSNSLSFEAADGTLQEQRYTIARDFTSWNISLSAAYRDNRDVQDEYMVYLGFTLKAFPEQSLSLRH